MDEVANVHGGYDGLVTHSTGLYRGPYGILASRAQEHLAVSVTVNLHFLWILISPRAGKDPETMARYRHDREAIINRARCSIVLFLEEQSEITKERGGGVSRFVVRELRLRRVYRVKWLITDETNEMREEIWLNKWHFSWETIRRLRQCLPKISTENTFSTFLLKRVVLWVYNWKQDCLKNITSKLIDWTLV